MRESTGRAAGRATLVAANPGTTYPGTTDEVVQPLVERSGLAVGRDVFLAFSPEREDPANRRWRTRTIPKIGHCIPVDPFSLAWKARPHDARTRFIELAGEINAGMPEWVLRKLVEALNRRGRALRGDGTFDDPAYVVRHARLVVDTRHATCDVRAHRERIVRV
jgi:UDP-N-acetyl-D-mannosaminuronate dehydrogenase